MAGVNTILNAPEEVELAKELLKLNPDMGGVKFARGGEAMSIAVRIARSHQKKKRLPLVVIMAGMTGNWPQTLVQEKIWMGIFCQAWFLMGFLRL